MVGLFKINAIHVRNGEYVDKKNMFEFFKVQQKVDSKYIKTIIESKHLKFFSLSIK